jgi:hypothetical protein
MSRTRTIIVAIALLAAPVVTGCADAAGPSEPNVPSFDSSCTESQGVVC